MRVENDQLSFKPQIPENWNAYSFKVNFRDRIVKVSVSSKGTEFSLEGSESLDILVNNKVLTLVPNEQITA
jgi:maltose phosphorylase